MTREEAISRINNDLEWHKKELSKEYKIALNMAIEALQERKTEKWIPVSERLPEEYGDYLVTKNTIGWNCEEYTSNDIAYFDDDGFHKADKVTAWQPLPEPYKGNGE